jgi:hypothetical protein
MVILSVNSIFSILRVRTGCLTNSVRADEGVSIIFVN